MKDVKINISATGFPSQFVSDAEKLQMLLGYRLVRLFNTSGSRRMETNVGFMTNGETFTGLGCMREVSSCWQVQE